MPIAARLALLLVLTACGGRAIVVSTTATDDGSTGSLAPLFRASYPEHAPPGTLTIQCLPEPLPTGGDGLPNCFVVTARFPDGTGGAQDIATCRQCGEPGLEPFVPSIAVQSIGDGLAGYQCLCTIHALPRGAMCPPLDESSSSWCYAAEVDGSDPDGGPLVGGPCEAARIGFTGLTGEGPVYLACFAPGLTP